MTHPLSGSVSAEDSARLCRNYRYAAERMMRILGGWIALTPELSAKLLMGRHVWDNAQHCDAFGKRLPELRAPAQVSEPASERFAAFMNALEEPGAPRQTVERLTGVYRVLKPHLLAAYQAHLDRANPVYEPPTRRILARCIEDERRHITAGETVLRHLLTAPALEERAAAWRKRLEDLLAASGGVTGTGLASAVAVAPETSAPSLSDDPREFIRLEQSGAGWSVPGDLQSALEGFGGALVKGDAAGMRRWLLPDCAWGDGLEAALRVPGLSSHRLVAFARVGHQRVVKFRLEGLQGAVTLTSRWVPLPEGWRAAALDLVALDIAQPA